MKFLGSGELDTSLKYLWTFSIVLRFIHMYSISKVFSSGKIYVFCMDLRTNSDYFPVQH
jgi:hypothetical protein